MRQVRRACAAKGLPVADVLRFLTYADGYGQFALGRERYLELDRSPRRRALRRLPGLHRAVPATACTWRERLIRAQELFACEC